MAVQGNRYKIKKSAPTHTIKGSGKWPVEQREAFVVAAAFRRRNLSPDQKRQLGDEQKRLCKALRKQDAKQWTQARLASMFGVGQQTVSDWLDISITGAGNTYRRPDARVTLSQDDKHEVAARVAAGESQAQVAADFGVSQQHVSRASRRNHWAELAIWSNRRLGEMLRMAQEEGTLAKRGGDQKSNSHAASLISLDDIDIKFDQSARAQKLAGIEEETIEQYVVSVAERHDDGVEISRAGLMRWPEGDSALRPCDVSGECPFLC